MTAPKVTVMMPVYNGESYLRSAIDSILLQTFSDFELLIVDDGSTDQTPEIISSYNDQRIRILRNEANKGLAFSRKLGLDNAKGEYVAILDSDDIALPNRLQVQTRYLDANRKISLIGSGIEIIDADGSQIEIIGMESDSLRNRWSLLFSNPIFNSSAMYRRMDALEVGGYDVKVPHGVDDYELWSRIAAQKKICQLDEPLVKYRKHERSLSHLENEGMNRQSCLVIRRNVYTLTGIDIPFEVARCLSDKPVQRKFNNTIAAEACQTIVRCAVALKTENSDDQGAVRVLCSLALDEIYRVSKNSEGYRRSALLVGLAMVLKYFAREIHSVTTARFVARMIVTDRARVRLMSYNQRLYEKLSKERRLQSDG